MSTPSAPIPAGWYPDPAGSFQQRWWTGTSWTNDFAQYRPTLIHSAPVAESLQQAAPAEQLAAGVIPQFPGAAQLAASTQAAAAAQPAAVTQTLTHDPAPQSPTAFLPAADQPPQTVVAQPNAGTATLIPVRQPSSSSIASRDLNPTFGTEYQPFGYKPEVRRGTIQEYSSLRYTGYVWVLTALPALLLGSFVLMASALPVIYTGFMQLMLLIVFIVASFTMALLDCRALQREAHDDTAGPLLALATPLPYLIGRAWYASRETGRNTLAPLFVFIGVAAAVALALLLAPGLWSLVTTANPL